MNTMDRQRAWTGPALFSFGFRPFFLGAGVWAALIMALWIVMLSGRLDLPTRFDPVGWHAHEFLFGYLGAVMAGFLMTAVPNWTGRMPLVGWPLAVLFALWLIGRVAVTVSALLPPLAAPVADLAFPLALLAAMGREVVAGRNWRNLVVLGMLALFTLGNAAFHLDALRGGAPAQGAGLRLGLGAAILLVALIGGRIIPSFTRNWLAKRGPGRLPTPPDRRFDKAALLALLGAVLLWITLPEAPLTAVALILAGGLHAVRLSRWAGDRCGAEPLVWVLHLAYGFVPLGALTLGGAILFPAALSPAVAQHLWMAGGIGLMTLAVMTRATRGHTGQALTASRGTTALYLAVTLAVLARLAAGLVPGSADLFLRLSALGWIAGFGGFALLYGGLLLRPRARR